MMRVMVVRGGGNEKGLISKIESNQINIDWMDGHFPRFSRFSSSTQTKTRQRCNSQTRSLTLTLFSHPQCRLSSIHNNPQRFPPLSQKIPTHPYSSSTTSTSYKLKSAPYAPWRTKRSTPCEFFTPPGLSQRVFQLFLPLAD